MRTETRTRREDLGRLAAKTLWVLILLLLPSAVHAEESLGLGPKVIAQTSEPTVVIGSELELTLKLVGLYERFVPPNLADFEVTARYRKERHVMVTKPQSGGRQGRKRVPERVKVRVLELGYRLRPLRVGEATIGAARLKLKGGKETRSLALKVKVINPPEALTAERAQNASPPPGAEVWLHAYPLTTRVVAGQPFVLAWDILYKPGFDVHPVAVKRAPRLGEVTHGETLLTPVSPDQVTRGGKEWKRLRYSRRWVVAKDPTHLTVDPMRLVVRVDGKYPRAVVTSQSYRVKVSALPKGAPHGFRAGHVGRFQVKTQVLDSSGERPVAIKAGQQIFIDLSVKGTGNLLALKAPRLVGAEYFDVKQVRAPGKETLVRHAEGIRGERRFRYVLRPTRPGKIVLPTAVFAYYDPARKAYVTVRKENDSIRVRTVMDTLYGALTLGEKDRTAVRAELGWPFLGVTYVVGVNDTTEVSPQFRLVFGRNLKADIVGIEPGFEWRMKLLQRGRFALALRANVAAIIWVPTDGSEGLYGIRFGGPAIITSWQFNGRVSGFAGINLPMALTLGEDLKFYLPLMTELGVEARVFQNDSVTVNASGVIAAGPEFCFGTCPKLSPSMQLTVGASILW